MVGVWRCASSTCMLLVCTHQLHARRCFEHNAISNKRCAHKTKQNNIRRGRQNKTTRVVRVARRALWRAGRGMRPSTVFNLAHAALHRPCRGRRDRLVATRRCGISTLRYVPIFGAGVLYNILRDGGVADGGKEGQDCAYLRAPSPSFYLNAIAPDCALYISKRRFYTVCRADQFSCRFSVCQHFIYVGAPRANLQHVAQQVKRWRFVALKRHSYARNVAALAPSISFHRWAFFSSRRLVQLILLRIAADVVSLCIGC